MKLNFGISSALILVLAQTTAVVQADDVVKPSTVGRWEYTLRKYGLSTDFGPNQRPGPKGRQRGRVVEDGDDKKNVARVPLVDFDFDREYYGTVLVGEPPQSFKIDFDTGSSRFILSSKGCTECSGTTRYDSSLSRTFRLNSEDTPSSVPSSSSTNTTSATSMPRYPLSKPPHDPNAWHITYGDMTHAEGFLGRDHVTIGATSTTEGGNGKKGGSGGLTVQHQELALVTSESANFDEAIDGIMGLAFGVLSSSSSSGGGTPKAAPTKTVFENMMAQGLVDRGMFSFYLGKSSRGGGGEVLFGGWDPARIKDGEELVFTNVTRPNYWQINVENVFVANRRVDYTPVKPLTYLTPKAPPSSPPSSPSEKRSNIAGIVDTGTTLMIAPVRLTNAIHALIPYARVIGQSWAVPCNLGQTHGSSKIELQVEGRRFAIPFEDMVREPVDQPSGLAATDESPSSSSSSQKVDDEDDNNVSEGGKGGKGRKGSGLCFSGVQSSGANFMIIGDVFIKNNYVVFDQEHQRVGIAPLKLADPLPLSSSSPSSSSPSSSVAEKETEKKGKKEKARKGKKGAPKKEGDGKDKKEKEKREVVRIKMGWEIMNPSGEDVKARIAGGAHASV
ncbi:hypothetical protein BGZ47_009627 [Haplosporangium gracile]|nr:hypothetical protein BGZ47_009627 [Haplosporangium gracile]